jgi:hypothetical protein
MELRHQGGGYPLPGLLEEPPSLLAAPSGPEAPVTLMRPLGRSHRNAAKVIEQLMANGVRFRVYPQGFGMTLPKKPMTPAAICWIEEHADEVTEVLDMLTPDPWQRLH